MTQRPPYRDSSKQIRARLHQRIRRLDYLFSNTEQEEDPGFSPAVKVLLVLAAVILMFSCLIPVLAFLRLLLQ